MATKTRKKKTPPSKRPRQEVLPEMKIEVPDIENAAGKYLDVMHERMELTRQETTRKQELFELMKQHKLNDYEFGNYIVRLVKDTVERVEVAKKKEPKKEDRP